MELLIWLNLRGLATPLGQEYALNLPRVQNPGALFPVVPSFYAFRSSFLKEGRKEKTINSLYCRYDHEVSLKWYYDQIFTP